MLLSWGAILQILAGITLLEIYQSEAPLNTLEQAEI